MLVGAAAAMAVAGVLGYHFLSSSPKVVRLLVLLAGLSAGVLLAWFSGPGREFIGFARESYLEGRRVVWPSRKETLQATLVVFGFVLVMALFLFIADKGIEWVVYDLLLGWRA